MQWKSRMDAKFGLKLGPVLTIYFFHFYIHNYFARIQQEGTAPVPPLNLRLDNFIMHDKVELTIPPFDNVPVLAALKGSDAPPPTGSGAGGSPTSDRKKKDTNMVRNPEIEPRYLADTEFGKDVRTLKMGPRRR